MCKFVGWYSCPTSTRAVARHVETRPPTVKPSSPPPPTRSARHPTPRSSASPSAAGLTRRAFYGHFANRDALVLAVIDVGAERLNAVAAATDHPHAPAAIALLGARLWGAVEHVRLLAGMAVREPYAAHAAEALQPVRDRLRVLVERGIAEGTVRPDIRPATLARLIEASAIAVLDRRRRDRASATPRAAASSCSPCSARPASPGRPAPSSSPRRPSCRPPATTPRGGPRVRIELRGVGKGRRSQALAPTTIGFESGRATLARAETEQRPTVLGLLAAGRMRPDTRFRHDRRPSGCRRDPSRDRARRRTRRLRPGPRRHRRRRRRRGAHVRGHPVEPGLGLALARRPRPPRPRPRADRERRPRRPPAPAHRAGDPAPRRRRGPRARLPRPARRRSARVVDPRQEPRRPRIRGARRSPATPRRRRSARPR